MIEFLASDKGKRKEEKMQDRLKFRMFNKLVKKFSYFSLPELQVCLNRDFKSGLIFPMDESIEDNAIYMGEYEEIQFSTGLKDKNNKLIFEGDIVEVQYVGAQIPLFKNEYCQQPENERFDVFCHKDWLKFCAKNDHYRKTCEIHSLDLEKIRTNTYNKVYEVIGNIYENPELLEQSND